MSGSDWVCLPPILKGSLGLTKIKELKLRVVLLKEGETLKLKKELFSFLLMAK